MYNNEIGVITK